MMLIGVCAGKIAGSSSRFDSQCMTWHAAYLSHSVFSGPVFLPQRDEGRGLEEGRATDNSSWRRLGVREDRREKG